MTLESTIEKYFVKSAEEVGGETFKLEARGKRGWPDRGALLPGLGFVLVELKRPRGGKLSQHQKDLHALLKRYGEDVFVLNSVELIDEFFMFYYPPMPHAS